MLVVAVALSVIFYPMIATYIIVSVIAKGVQESVGYFTGAKGYQLQYALNKKFKKKKSVQTKKTKYTIKKLKKKKTYYIRVRAYKMNGRKKVYGKWSKVKKVKIKK